MIGCRVDTFIHTFSRQTADFILKSDAQHSNLVSMAMCHSPPCCEVLCLALCAFLLKHQHHLIGSFKIKWLLKLQSVRPTRPESQPFAHLQVIKKFPDFASLQVKTFLSLFYRCSPSNTDHRSEFPKAVAHG